MMHGYNCGCPDCREAHPDAFANVGVTPHPGSEGLREKAEQLWRQLESYEGTTEGAVRFITRALQENHAAVLEAAAQACKMPRQFTGGPSTARIQAWADCENAIRALSPAAVSEAREKMLAKAQTAAEKLFIQVLCHKIPVMALNDCDGVAAAIEFHDEKVRVKAKLQEAEWWATPFGETSVHLCPLEDNCAECDLKRQRLAELSRLAGEKGGGG